MSIAVRDGGAFISGQNGVGKSTLLRTVGLTLAGQGAAVFLTDENFRGTNHMESVSAAAVLDELARHGMAIVSSYNVVQAHTNGIALLSQHGFGHAIDAKARKVHTWLSAHLAHPQNCEGVLQP